jgi:SAM-dependent methyltransferase
MSHTTDDNRVRVAPTDAEAAERLATRLFETLTTGSELLTVELGRRLGLYDALRRHGPATVPQFAAGTGLLPRYAREWLEQQAAAGFLAVQDVNAAQDARVYELPAGHASVLLDPDNPHYAMGVPLLVTSLAQAIDAVEAAYRSGGAVAYSGFGEGLQQGIALLNRPGFTNNLAGWIATMPDIDGALTSGGTVLDAGCGTGWSTIALARSFPRSRVIGLDMDEASIAMARRNAAEARLGDQVEFVVGNAAAQVVDALGAWRCTLATVFEALHDMGSPVDALRGLRETLAPGGAVLVADERVADEFTAPAGDEERMQFAISVVHCLPATMAESDAVANGAVLRAPTVRAWAHAAGFSRVTELPIEHPFWRFYRMDE